MSDPNIIQIGSWQFTLPAGWVQDQSAGEQSDVENQSYFVSADKARGFYLETWDFAASKFKNSNLKAVEYIAAIEKKVFADMEEYTWKSLEDEARDMCEFAVSTVDYFDKQCHYRIVCRSIAALPDIVRATFHDYKCEDLALSQDGSQEILDSIVKVAK